MAAVSEEIATEVPIVEVWKETVMELRSTVKSRDWVRVVEIFKKHAGIHATRINKWRDTALHAAIETSSEDDVVLLMIQAIIMNVNEDSVKAVRILSLENDAGDTPLHCAASRGSLLICEWIIRWADVSLIGMRNTNGETPLFLAALHGHREAFLLLHDAAGEDSSLYWRRGNGDTILHCTIEREFFDLSYIIIHLCHGISSLINEKGESPLAVLASTPSTFISSIHFNWWERLLLRFLCAEKPETKIHNGGGEELIHIDIEERWPYELMIRPKKKSRWSRVVEKLESTRETVFTVPGTLVKIKRRLLGLEIMERLVKEDSWYDALIDTDVRGDLEHFPTWSTSVNQAGSIWGGIERWPWALLAAAKHSAAAMVKEILRQKPFAIDDETSDKKNIVLLAIETRQSDILKILIKHQSWSEKRLKYAKDEKGNTALHLAAKCSDNPNISNSLVQLQWEVHWFEYVKELMPAYFMNELNVDGKTPWMVFEAEHRGMLEETGKSVKEMSGNYMVATTLISSVTFATCYQIPGGYEGEHGTPIVGSTTAFQLFSITALVSFCFSVTSLAVFLAICSSRNDQYQHYRRSLPLKLLVGFFSLFVSILSMLISFCAAHVFELNPKHKSRSIPLYLSVTSIPLCFYSATQIPLYWDLLVSILARVPFSREFHVGQQEQQEVEEEVVEEKETDEKGFRKRDIIRITRRRRIIKRDSLDDMVKKIEAKEADQTYVWLK